MSAPSDVYGTSYYDIDDLIRSAWIDAGGITSLMTAEALDEAKLRLRQLFDTWAQSGILLWCIEKVGRRATPGQMVIEIPAGSNKVLTVLRRSATSGGTASYTTGQMILDLDGISTQGIADISFNMAGVVTEAAKIYYSDDGVNYTLMQTVSTVNLSTTLENYILLRRSVMSRYIKVTCAGITFTNGLAYYNPYDLPLTQMGRDQYDLYPNKTFPGDPLQFWPNRDRDGYELYLWPVPQNSTYVIVTTFRRMINDITAFSQQPDVPITWYTALTTGLAYRLAPLVPKEAREDIALLKAKADEAFNIARNDESDAGPVFLAPNIRPYTR